MVKLKLKEIEFDEDIYPRRNESKKTIDAYKESMEAGANFPDIKVQKILVDGKEITIILDGKHRYEAARLAKLDEIDVTYWKDEILDKKENLKALRMEAIESNLRHGDRLLNTDKRWFCEIMAKEDVDITISYEEFGKIFAVPKSTIGDWIGAIRARQKSSRDSLIYRLSFLGWTDKDIGEKVGLTEDSIRKNRKNSDFGKIPVDYHDNKKSINELAEFYGLDVPTLWHILLDKRADLDKMDKFRKSEYYGKDGDGFKNFDIWNYASCDDRLGIVHPGRIPGQALMNILYYYTDEGDLVLDLMAGGGVTNDACLVMGRKCHSYDINPVREDIIKHDMKDGIPDKGKKYKLIFWDPPYWNLMAPQYSDDGIADYSLSDWYEFIRDRAKEIKNLLDKDGTFVFAIQAMEDEKNTKKFIDLTFECVKIFEEEDLKYSFRISQPNGASVKSARDIEWAKKNKKLLIINRDFVVFKK